MNTVKNSPTLWIRIDLRPRGQIGPGKIALLREIRAKGSISAAARALSMSYRRAWLLIDEMNKTFTQPVIATSVGGREHGGALLTEFGGDLIALYEAINEKAASAAQAELTRLENAAKPVR